MPDLAQTIGPSSPAAHPDAERLRAYALGSISNAEIEQCSEHLEQCETCRRFVDSVPGDRLVSLVQGAAASSAAAGLLRVQLGYEILEEIGRGGMAVVFKARQLDLGRIVALKQIKSEVVDAEDLARFRTEAGAMARVQHPNIVQVYDVGEQQGRPYIACEFVSGGGLDRQLSGNPLPVRAACRLVATLARAVEVAHEHAVIHRDLKPSNVLLAWDGEPPVEPVVTADESFWQRVTPKISDFGLAKQLDQDELQTQTGAILGTPAYMAPEQASGQGNEIAPHTDVYALGVILYETLTGRRPFQGATLLETLDLVRTAEPVPPRRWLPSLPRDLDVICLKCLEKDPRRRYRTARELADDLDHLLAGEPIRARPVAAWERVLKWSRRRPAWAALVLLSTLAMTGLVAGTLWHNRRLRAEVKRANANETVALANFLSGYDALDQMLKQLASDLPATEAGRELYARAMRRALGYFETVFKDADDSNPKVRLARGMLLTYAGDAHHSLGEFDLALDALRQARERFEAVRIEDSDYLPAREHLALCSRVMAEVFYATEQFADAERFCLESIETQGDLLAQSAAISRLNYRQARCYQLLAQVYLKTNRSQLATLSFEAAYSFAQKHAETDPADVVNQIILAEACYLLALDRSQERRWSDADSYLRRAEAAAEQSLKNGPSPRATTTLGLTYAVWASIEEAQGRTDEALRKCDQGIAVIADLLAVEPTDREGRAVLAQLQDKKTELLSTAGRQDAVIAATNKPAEFADGDDRAAVQLAVARIDAAKAHQTDARWSEAESSLRNAESVLLDHSGASRSADTRSPAVTRTLADVYFQWGELEIGRGRLDEAVLRYDQSIAKLNELLTQQPTDKGALSALSWRYRLKAWHLSRAGKMDEGFAAWDQAIQHADRNDGQYYRTERALERALVGEHKAATAEADQVAANPDLSGMTALHLARVYSCSIDGLAQDVRLGDTDRERRRRTYAANAVTCLSRAEKDLRAEPNKLDEVDSDDQFAALRATTEYESWRARLPRAKTGSPRSEQSL